VDRLPGEPDVGPGEIAAEEGPMRPLESEQAQGECRSERFGGRPTDPPEREEARERPDGDDEETDLHDREALQPQGLRAGRAAETIEDERVGPGRRHQHDERRVIQEVGLAIEE